MPEYPTTVIIYDFDTLKCGKLEFNNLENLDEYRKLQLRLMDMQETMRSLQALFGGTIILVEAWVRDKSGNRVHITDQPIALEVQNYISNRDIDYLKEVDPGLVAVM